MRAVVLLPCLVLATAAVAAADGPGPRPTALRACRASATLSIDGRLNELEWTKAEACTNLVQGSPLEGSWPTQRSEIRVMYDENAIYVGARLYDARPDSIVTELARRDGGTRSDKFTVYLDPYHDKRSGYFFGVNAAGTQYDGTLYNDAWSDNSWDAVWEGRSHRDEHGWTTEIRVPYSQLRFANANPQRWGINFLREMGRGFEDIYLVPRPKNASGFVSLFPTLTGLENVRPTNAIEIVPYVTGKGEFLQHEEGDPFNDGSIYKPNAGADLRMPVGSKLTLNGTVNPDFGQVEVDPAVVNLSDVETFFPEKRPFFVEGSSIFSAGQQGASDYWGFNYSQPTFFYSRRIGHAPQGGLPGDAAYSDVPAGTTILGAAKLSGKLSPSLNFGTLHTLTSREDADIQRGDGSQYDAVVEPSSYYGVARMLKEYKDQRHGLGLLGTYAYRDLDGTGLENQFNQNAAAAIVDGWHFLDKNKMWVLSGWAGGSFIQGTKAQITAVQTSSTHYYQRPDAGHVEVDPNATSLAGSGARVWLNKEKGNWRSNSAIGFLSPGLELNDLGFMTRADVINAHAVLGYRWTTPTKHINNHNFYASVFGSADFDENITSAGVWARQFWWFTNNWVASISGAYNPETVNPRRSRGGPLMLNMPGYELNLFGDTDGSRKRYYNVNYYQYVQPEENSFNYQIFPFFVYKPVSNIRFEIGPGYESSRDGAFHIGTVADPTATATYGSRYVFSRLDQQTVSANIRLNVSFTPRMTLQFYGQPLISTGRYNDFRELARPKSLDFIPQGSGAWTYDPATREFDLDGPGGADPVIKDFNFKSLRGNAVFRWEYLPGSAFYLVWTQQRTDQESIPDLDFGPSFKRLVEADADNIFLAKLTYYLNW